MEKDRKRGDEARDEGRDEPLRKPDEGDDWAGEPLEEAERRRGEGRGLDEPEKQPPPPDLKE